MWYRRALSHSVENVSHKYSRFASQLLKCMNVSYNMLHDSVSGYLFADSFREDVFEYWKKTFAHLTMFPVVTVSKKQENG